MKVKLIKTNPINSPDEIPSLKLGKIYEVIAIDIGNYESYLILNEHGEPLSYKTNFFEVVDNSRPEFWVSKTDKYGITFTAPESWQKSYFFEKYYDYNEYNDNFSARIQFYRDCRDFYGINVLLPPNNYPMDIEDLSNVKCLSKEAYLLPTDKENIFEFIDESYKDESKKVINLTKRKIYNILEIRDMFWYKIVDDLGKEFFYPKYMFKKI
jgi:hypothetical protein